MVSLFNLGLPKEFRSVVFVVGAIFILAGFALILIVPSAVQEASTLAAIGSMLMLVTAIGWVK